jgi:5-methylcytosine-specific restriction protein A
MTIDQDRLAENLKAEFGLYWNISIEWRNGEELVNVTPWQVERDAEFTVQGAIGWKSLRIEFIPGDFAGPLVREFGHNWPSRRPIFEAFAERLTSEGGEFRFEVNGIDVNTSSYANVPNVWNTYTVSWKKVPIELPEDEPVLLADELSEKLFPFVGMNLSLLTQFGWNADDTSDGLGDFTEGRIEGTLRRVFSNRYERSSVNRSACIAYHGSACIVCGLEFGKVYGSFASDFIEVHHIIPLSKVEKGYRLDPRRDLVPVCPNCHAAIHMREPPYSVDDMRRMLLAPT